MENYKNLFLKTNVEELFFFRNFFLIKDLGLGVKNFKLKKGYYLKKKKEFKFGSLITDNSLVHRISMIPLVSSFEKFDLKKGYEEKKNNLGKIFLKKINFEKKEMEIYSDDLKIEINELGKNLGFEKIKIQKGILLTILEENREIDLEGEIYLGRFIDHAKFQKIINYSYNILYEIIETKIDETKIDETKIFRMRKEEIIEFEKKKYLILKSKKILKSNLKIKKKFYFLKKSKIFNVYLEVDENKNPISGIKRAINFLKNGLKEILEKIKKT